MNFNIAQSSTLHVVATEDAGLLAESLRGRLADALALADADPELVAAVASQKAVEDRLGRLRKAERFLSNLSKASREKIAAKADGSVNASIASASEGAAPDCAQLACVIGV